MYPDPESTHFEHDALFAFIAEMSLPSNALSIHNDILHLDLPRLSLLGVIGRQQQKSRGETSLLVRLNRHRSAAQKEASLPNLMP